VRQYGAEEALHKPCRAVEIARTRAVCGVTFPANGCAVGRTRAQATPSPDTRATTDRDTRKRYAELSYDILFFESFAG